MPLSAFLSAVYSKKCLEEELPTDCNPASLEIDAFDHPFFSSGEEQFLSKTAIVLTGYTSLNRFVQIFYRNIHIVRRTNIK